MTEQRPRDPDLRGAVDAANCMISDCQDTDRLQDVCYAEGVRDALQWALGEIDPEDREHLERLLDGDDDENPEFGERAACKHCDLDIEWVGDRWADRGGNRHCPSRTRRLHEPAP